jgi:hypothetical protein
MTDVAVIHPNESVPILPASNAITPSDMIARALERGASIETLEKLITLQERWEANQARKAYDAAMASAKAEIPVISKNRTVDFTSAKGRTHYRHEDLGEIARTVTPILARFGLSYRFRTSANVNEPVHVTCIISHRDGHFEEVTLPGPRDESGNKNSLQAVGSTLTYLQRMTLKAALGLAASEDDDGKGSQTGTANPISADDAASLRAKMQAAGLAEARFCTVMKIEAVEDLPSSKYDEAERRIMDFSNAKRARDNAN